MSQTSQVKVADIHSDLSGLLSALDGIILGKGHELRLALACLLARGHLLIEDMPGMGKTTLAHGLATVLGLEFKRIQFTSDLLPADILGVSIYTPQTESFRFHPGPVFTQLVLADEINRTTPKTQSALLEAMEERQISAEGETFKLPDPFFVIATQNPQQMLGTFPLPESQLDRFLMRISLGYPDREAERRLLKLHRREDMLAELGAGDGAGMGSDKLIRLQNTVHTVHSSDALLDYAQDLIDATRSSPMFVNGLSPRAGLALVNAARAWAMIDGRKMVLPEDIQAVAPAVITHRLQPSEDHVSESITTLVTQLLDSVAIP
jgi:MoxR-like ATPase